MQAVAAEQVTCPHGVTWPHVGTAPQPAEHEKAEKPKKTSFSRDERGAVDILVALAIGLTVLITVALISAYIGASIYNVMKPELNNLQNESPTEYGYLESIITGAFKGMQIFGNFIPVVVIVMVAVIVIGFVMYLRSRGRASAGVGEL